MKSTCLVIFIFTFMLLHRFGTSSNTMMVIYSNVTCLEKERQSLLIFKQSLTSGLNRVSSWTGGECCEWRGVGCDHRNGHVIKLDLRTPVSLVGKTLYKGNWMGGELSHSLLNLKHLRYLDLSLNNFSGNVPEFLGSFKRLEYLNLSRSGFDGVVPHHLGNLSRLQYLDLNIYYVLDINGLHVPYDSESFLVIDNLCWVSSLASLKHLDLSGIDIGEDNDWFLPVSMLHSLLTLNLVSCDINIPSVKFTNFTSLNSLDLSHNDINSTIPVWIANLTNLMQLHLKDNYFHGQLPDFLGTLNLASLDLSENSFNASMPNMFPNLSSLVLLDLSSNMFHGLFPLDAKLCNLSILNLSWNRFSGDLSSFMGNVSDCLLRSLKDLNLESNQFMGSIPNKLVNFKKLEYLDLSINTLSGSIPSYLGDLSSLREMNFFHNQLSGNIPASLGLISMLEKLDLSSNQLNGSIPGSIGLLSRVERLDLSGNQLSGNIPVTLGLLPRLEKLYLFYNKLNGSIPASFGQLSKLETLDVSHNSLVGVLSEVHFTTMKNLTHLDLSYNSLALNVSSRWIPPFQLKVFRAQSCNIGPHFPDVLQTQVNLRTLDLSYSSIKDTIPEWFENISAYIDDIDLSHNQIGGKLPPFHGNTSSRYLMLNSNNFEGSLSAFPSNVRLLDVSDNLLSGQVPHTDVTMNPSLEILNLSKNRFTGSIPKHLCKLLSIEVLDLSQNKFSGTLPGCVGNLSSLKAIDVANNMIIGIVPSTLGSLTQLKSLHLHNNILKGNLPLSFKNLTGLVTMDLGNNLFMGSIPIWIGENLSNLRILNLKSNKFTGKIPLQLCLLNNLQHLNLAHNDISGTIPHCFGNLSGMINNQVNLGYTTIDYYIENIVASVKGIELVYTTTIQFLTSLDISSNNINGEIPDTLMNLVGLKNFNLSRNMLRGQIPTTIGNLNQLESLDLSVNNLDGRIPQSLSSLNFLSHLNVSFNNLSGSIPDGNQLQTLNGPSIYEGNTGLCGPPLSRSCKGNNSSYNHVCEDEDIDDNEDSWFYIGLGSGFAIGFMGLLGSLHFIRSWRLVYFEILENVYGWLTLTPRLNLARLRRKFF